MNEDALEPPQCKLSCIDQLMFNKEGWCGGAVDVNEAWIDNAKT